MQPQNLRQTVKIISGFLAKYLESKELIVQAGGKYIKFKCINPEHDDKHPSMQINPSGRGVRCWSCGFTGDIIDVVQVLENRGDSKTSIIQDLAGRFNVKINLRPSDDEVYESEAIRAYSTLARVITETPLTGSVLEEVNRRWWTEDIRQEMGFGCVTSYEDISSSMKRLYSDKFLTEIGLLGDLPELIFQPDSLIFTILDNQGNPVAFSGRVVDKKSKYINTTTKNAKVKIFEKGKILYGLYQHLNKKEKLEPVHLVEGYPDVTTLRQNKIGALGICTDKISEDQVDELIKAGISSLIICLDGDKAGQDGNDRAIDLTVGSGINASVKELPEGIDPDDFVRDSGVDEFKELPVISPVRWKTKRLKNLDSYEIAEEVANFIAKETNSIKREAYVAELSEITDVNKFAISSEVERKLTGTAPNLEDERNRYLDVMVRRLERNKDKAETVISETLTAIQQLNTSRSTGLFTTGYASSIVEEAKRRGETIPRIPMLKKLQTISTDLGGLWPRENMILLGGKPNHSKTIFLCQLALEAAEMNDDFIVLYHSTDDLAEKILARMAAHLACQETQETWPTINMMLYPELFRNKFSILPDLRARVYDRLNGLTKEGRLLVLDSNAGQTVAFGAAWIDYVRKTIGRDLDKKIIYILDNFRMLSDLVEIQDETTRKKRISKFIKNEIVVKRGVTAIVTVEYTKLLPGTRPGNSNIKDASELEYDADLIMHIYNQLADAEQTGSAEECKFCWQRDGQQMPMIEVIFGKNKISDFKGIRVFDLSPAQALLVPVSEIELTNRGIGEKRIQT